MEKEPNNFLLCSTNTSNAINEIKSHYSQLCYKSDQSSITVFIEALFSRNIELLPTAKIIEDLLNSKFNSLATFLDQNFMQLTNIFDKSTRIERFDSDMVTNEFEFERTDSLLSEGFNSLVDLSNIVRNESSGSPSQVMEIIRSLTAEDQMDLII
jgi:hypothetical protein